MNLRTARFVRRTVSRPGVRGHVPRATNLPRPSVLLLAAAILWTVAYVSWAAGWMLDPAPFSVVRALRHIILCVFGVMLCLLIGGLLERIRGRSVWRTTCGAAILVLAAVTVHASTNELVFYVAASRWEGSAWRHIAQVMTDDVWIYSAWVMLYLALAADASRRDRETQLAQASAQALDARHRLLVQQINPHFLFNALNTVYSLVLEHDETRARQSLLALSAFLRRSLDAETLLHVTLRNELQSVRDYLDIETARFGKRLSLNIDIPEALLDLELPNLILQPLVENCVKHGMRHCCGGVTVTLTAVVENSTLMVTVENEGPVAAPVAVRGIGLDHVAQRLRLLYGEAGGLDACPRDGGGFVARIRLPASA